MIISSFTIENFKGISKPVSIDFKPITLLFGPNSAGKSTVVQALHYAREIFERRNLDPDYTLSGGKSVDLGGFRNLINNHDTSATLSLRFDLDLKKIDLSDFIFGFIKPKESEHIEDWENGIYEVTSKIDSAWIKISIKYDIYRDKPMVTFYEVGINGQRIVEIKKTEGSLIKMILYHSDIFPEEIAKQYHIVTNAYLIDEILSDESYDADESMIDFLDHEDNMSKEIELLIGNKENRQYSKEDLEYYKRSGMEFYLKTDSVLPEWDKLLQFDDQFFKTFDDQIQYFPLALISTLVLGPARVITEDLKKLHYLGPLRSIPLRNYNANFTPNDSLWADGTAAWDTLFKSDPDFIEKVNDWLLSEDKLNAGYEVVQKKYKEIDTNSSLWISLINNDRLDREEVFSKELIALPEKRRVHLREWATDINVMPKDVGIGISQVLPIIVLALTKKAGLVTIEQPELHIHPAFQVALGDLFISQVKKKDIVFLLETHSEHLMLRFLRRIRETSENSLPPGKESLQPNQLTVYYVEQGQEGILLTKIRVDADGEFIDRWPKGFFSERAEELF